MGLLAEYKIGFQHLPLVDVAAAVPAMTLELRVGQPNQGAPPPFFVRATGESFRALEREFETTPFVDEYARLTRDGDTRQYQVLPTASMADQLDDRVDDFPRLQALATNRSVVEQISVQPDGWVQQRWFADRDAFLDYSAFWRENASFSLFRLTESDANGNPPTGLTDRQREALLTAYEMGYFDIPRTTSLDAVADEIGISAPALSERLRRAHAHLIEEVVAPVGYINGFTG
ncbi:helix-turn-helix domain-containing protein [Halorientalis brevis]|uniref:Helix-turn-helix domain-containing protein n=1 Tax=Halorientalis brevis TaxID=1126241 RepID=A0ABD6CAE4_9EURY|nr:helix-turn-helix domain-containing protein [Halorientalis brevis]